MPYLVDRQRALRGREIVAVIGIRRRRLRSCVILSDNSLYQTLTRPRTLIRRTLTPNRLVWERANHATLALPGRAPTLPNR